MSYVAKPEDEMLRRQRAQIARGWLPETSPVADAVLSGFSYISSLYSGMLAYVSDQSRILTASGGWLDLAANDFFGLRVKRKGTEDDAVFARRIIEEIFRERATRGGIQKAVADLTGFEVRMFEPFNVRDTGGLDTGYLGFDSIGRYGAVDFPRNIFIATLNPRGSGIPNVGGFDTALGGLDMGAEELADIKAISGAVTQSDIYALINATRAGGITAWVAIGLPPDGHLDIDFTSDFSQTVGPATS